MENKIYPLITRAIDIKESGTIVFDKFENGLRFIVMRGPAAFCGYVGVPKDHPLAGFDHDFLQFIDVHGGLTFSSASKGGWPEGYFWYGWDYAHAGDKSVYDHNINYPFPDTDKDWTLGEVIDDSYMAVQNFQTLMRLAEEIHKSAIAYII